MPPDPGTGGDTYCRYGEGSALCGSTAGGTITRNDAESFEAKNAPATGSCTPTPCEP